MTAGSTGQRKEHSESVLGDALHGVLQIVADGVLLRSLPYPLTPAQTARLRDARPAGPPPQPAPELERVQRRVSCQGAITVAHQRIHVGMTHAGATFDVEAADTTIRIYDGDQLITEVPRTTTKPLARFKVRKPEGRRQQAGVAQIDA